MTALASWCETETWLADAPVDEIVPMLFRMGRGGDRLRGKLAAGGDFNDPRCRTAVGISTDTPVVVPPGRRVYVFNPRSWDAAAITALQHRTMPMNPFLPSRLARRLRCCAAVRPPPPPTARPATGR